jgi:hypothetical protein
MAYTIKTEGTYYLHDIVPEFELSHPRWIWVFFHPEHNPEHQHVALHLRVSQVEKQSIYDTFHFGVDKAGQFIGAPWAKPDGLNAIRWIKTENKRYILVENGEVGDEPDGWGSFYSQRWYSFSKFEYKDMQLEFNLAMKETGWKR